MQLKLALAVVLLTGGTSVVADTSDDYLACSAHFEARAIWGATVGSDQGYVDGMERRSDLLLDAYETANPTRWQSSSLLYDSFGSRENRNEARDLMINDTLIYFADLAPMSGQAPLCAEDAICQVCSDVLRSSME